MPISEGPVNLSWPAIMKTVNEDPHAFYAEGGWNFLTGSGSVRLPLCLFWLSNSDDRHRMMNRKNLRKALNLRVIVMSLMNPAAVARIANLTVSVLCLDLITSADLS